MVYYCRTPEAKTCIRVTVRQPIVDLEQYLSIIQFDTSVNWMVRRILNSYPNKYSDIQHNKLTYFPLNTIFD